MKYKHSKEKQKEVLKKYVQGGYADKGVYVETLDEKIDLSEEGRVRARKTQKGGNKSFGELREMHGASPEALAFNGGGAIKNNKKIKLTYPKISVSEPIFIKGDKESFFSTKDSYEIRIGNSSLDFATKKQADAIYNEIKNFDNEKQWLEFFQSYLLRRLPKRAFITNTYKETWENFSEPKLGKSLSIEDFYKVKRGTYFKFEHYNFGKKRMTEFVFDSTINDRVLGWMKIGNDWQYGDSLYNYEGKICAFSGAEILEVNEMIAPPNKFELPNLEKTPNLSKKTKDNLYALWDFVKNRKKKSDKILEMEKQYEEIMPFLSKLTIEGVPTKIQALVMIDAKSNRMKKVVSKETVEKTIDKFWNDYYSGKDTFAYGGAMTKSYDYGGDFESPRIYIVNAEAYNDNIDEGVWLDFSDYENADELMNDIQNWLDEWGVEEYQIIDGEYLPTPMGMDVSDLRKANFEEIYMLMDVAKEKGISIDDAYEEVYGENDNFAEGGSLGNHGLKQGDQIIKTMSGGVQKIKTKSGDIVYVNLANGYRGDVPPLPFDGGGRLKSALMRDRKNVNSSEDYEVRYSKDKSHRSGYTKPKMSRTQFEEESFEFFDNGGGVKQVDLFQHYNKQPKELSEIVNAYMEKFDEGDYDYEDSKNFLKEVELVGYTFDYGLDNEPYALRPIGVKLSQVEGYEDMDFNKGGRTRERKYVNYSQKHEVRYSKDKPHRRGYGYAEGGFMTDPNFGDFQNGVYAKGGAVYRESKYLTKEQWEKWNDYVKTGKIDGKKEKNMFTVARHIGVSVAQINAYEREKYKNYATGGVTKNYINRKQLNTITVKKGDQKLTYKVSDVYNGAYKLEDGGNLEKMAFYIPKRNVVKVQLRDGKDVKVANGYWIKKGAKPIHTSKYDDGGSIDDFSLEKLQKKEIELAINGYQKYTEEKWKGYDYFSEKYAVNELAELELDLRRLNDGKISPTKIIGKGYKNPKKVAQEWLQSQIKKQKSIIETNGLSNKTNHSNFRHELVNAKRENIISEVKFNKLLDESNEIIESLGETYSYGGFFNDGGQLEMEYAGGGKTKFVNWRNFPDKKVLGFYNVKGTDFDTNVNLNNFERADDLNYSLYPTNENRDKFTSINVKSNSLNRISKGLAVKGITNDGKSVTIKRLKDLSFSGGGEMSGLKVGQKYRTKKGDVLTIKDFDIENHVTTDDGKGKLSSVAIQRISVFKDLVNDGELVILNAGGGSTTKRGGAMVLAKQIRKDGESWQSALKRANQQLKK